MARPTLRRRCTGHFGCAAPFGAISSLVMSLAAITCVALVAKVPIGDPHLEDPGRNTSDHVVLRLRIPTCALAWSPDGGMLAISEFGPVVRLWNRTTGQVVRVEMGEEGVSLPVYAMDWSPDGRTLAIGTTKGSLILWDVVAKRRRREDLASGHWIRALRWSPDGRTLAIARPGKSVRLLSVETGQEIDLVGSEESATALDFSPDGSTLATGGVDGILRTWDAATGWPLLAFPSRAVIASLDFSPDGKILATGGSGPLWTWDAATGRARNEIGSREMSPFRLCFSPDGRRLAATSRGRVTLYDPATGGEAGRLPDFGDNIHLVSYSPDGRMLATGSLGSVVRIWEVSESTGGLAATRREYQGRDRPGIMTSPSAGPKG